MTNSMYLTRKALQSRMEGDRLLQEVESLGKSEKRLRKVLESKAGKYINKAENLYNQAWEGMI